jgi:hypothetical protein
LIKVEAMLDAPPAEESTVGDVVVPPALNPSEEQTDAAMVALTVA